MEKDNESKKIIYEFMMTPTHPIDPNLEFYHYSKILKKNI